jgi:hypothetical protein
MTPENNANQLSIKATDEVLQGQYATVAQISHTQEEFLFDWMSLLPPGGQLVARTIVSPAHAKRISAALADNIKRYEAQFGAIPEQNEQTPSVGFRTA